MIDSNYCTNVLISSLVFSCLDASEVFNNLEKKGVGLFSQTNQLETHLTPIREDFYNV